MAPKNKNLMFLTEEENHGVPYLHLCDKNDKCRRINLSDYSHDHTCLKDGLMNIFTNYVILTGEHKKRKPTPFVHKQKQSNNQNGQNKHKQAKKLNKLKPKQHKTQKMHIKLKKPNQTRRKKK